MEIRFYLIPIEMINAGRGPKYIKWRFNPDGLDVQWSMKDFGSLDIGLIAVNADQADHDILSAAEDVTAIPANLDNNIPAGALNTVRAELEALGIPGNWVGTSNTYREVVRFVAGLFQFAQRHAGLHDSQQIRPTNVNLSNTWSDLPAQWRSNLQATADSFGYDYSGVTGATTLRVVLKALGDQWADTPIHFGFISL